jgi:hypothetical protein
MEINDKPVTATDLLRLAFIGTAVEPHLDRIAHRDARTLEQIGEQEGLTRQRVAQIVGRKIK